MKLARIFLLAAWTSAGLIATVPAAAAGEHLPPGIAWHRGSVDSAFAQARADAKPLFLYWGAEWCPPCNQVKATIFNQQAFIARTHGFVPVYLDGDRPNAQRLGARFKVRGYPTMILFKPDGSEIIRLPGEADFERYMHALALGLSAVRPAREVLATALADPGSLSTDEWNLLADYAWDVDETQLIDGGKLASTLQTLAGSAPRQPAALGARLNLQALGAAADRPNAEFDRPAALAALERTLADPVLGRAEFDLLVGRAVDFTEMLSEANSPARSRLVGEWHNLLLRLSSDSSLSAADRLDALDALVRVARLKPGGDGPPDALRSLVRSRAGAAVAACRNPYERVAVVSSAATALRSAGLMRESDDLLRGELKQSRAAYYLMLKLAANAKQRGDAKEALDWYGKAYESSTGPATRLQWGVTYLERIIELAPEDDARFDGAARRLLKDVDGMGDAFLDRNGRELNHLVGAMANWNQVGQHDDSVRAVLAGLQRACGRVPHGDAQHETCTAMLRQEARD